MLNVCVYNIFMSKYSYDFQKKYLAAHAIYFPAVPILGKDLLLSYKRKTIIESNEMLTDKHNAPNCHEDNFNI